jgi:hypothetical protein
MELTREQNQKIFQDGYLMLPGLAAEKLTNVALRAINHSVGKGLDPKDIASFRANSYCPELRNAPPIIDLLHKTALWKIAESIVGKGKLRLIGPPQIALRFPAMEIPGELHPHLDGLYSPNNRVRKDTIESFTMLAGVFLSSIPNQFWGNFCVWPGTHRLFEKYFQENGIDSLLKGMPPIQMPEPEQILAQTGDGMICHYQLAHTVVLNVSPYVRYAVFFRLAHADHAVHKNEALTNLWLEWPGLHR